MYPYCSLGVVQMYFTWLEAAHLDLLGLIALPLEPETAVLVGDVGQDDEDREGDERDDGLPQVDHVRRDELQHDEEPDVGEDREDGRHAEHLCKVTNDKK